MNPVATPDLDRLDNPQVTFSAQFSGRCWRCEKRFAPGWTIVRESPTQLAHVDCVEQEVEPPVTVTDSVLLDEALELVRALIRMSAGGSESSLAEINEAAVQGHFAIRERRSDG